MMNIGIFIRKTTPESGGAFTFAETVISGLASSGIPDRITIFHYGNAGKLAEEFKAQLPGRVVFQSLARSKVAGFIRRSYFGLFATALQKFVVRLSYSFGIHLPYPSSSPLDCASKLAKIDLLWFPTPDYEPVECPYIFTVWDLEHRAQPYFPEVSEKGEWNGREKYFSKALKRASYVITGTEVGKREITGSFGVNPDRVRLLPHPTPSFALASPGVRPLSGHLNLRPPYVVYPAQFWAHKNHIGLIESVAILRDQGLRIDCALVGSDKGNRKHVEKRVRELKIEDQVHFLGFVSREDLVALYQNALALVYPSLCGPENLPPLEAMALGCPVINADIEGAKEQLGDAAVLVRATESSAIADAIKNLSSTPSRRKELIEKGRLRAKGYTEREFTLDLEKIFNEYRVIRGLWE